MEPEGSLQQAHHLSLPWISSIQSIPLHPTSWKSIVILLSFHISADIGETISCSQYSDFTLNIMICVEESVNMYPFFHTNCWFLLWNQFWCFEHWLWRLILWENSTIYKINNQLDATKCWFIFSTCFEHYYAHPQEYISEYRFLVSKPVSRLGCVAQSC
jgi:hypothetical protein